jgi:hypothetical protein
MITPLERNGRRLIGVLAEYFPAGGTCEDLRRQFEKETSLSRQSFYDALKFVKAQGWLVADGRIYNLDPCGSWKAPIPSIGERLERARLENDRLDYVAGARAERIQELRSEVEDLRDWSGSGNGTAVVNLVRILTDTTASMRQRLRACALIIGYRSDPDTTAFARGFLEKVVTNPDTPIDYKLEAAEQLRKAEGDAMLRPTIERVTPPAPPIDPVKAKAEREALHERRRAHIERQAQLDAEQLARERLSGKW